MFKMRFGTALALLVALVSPLRAQCTTTCQMSSQSGYVEGQCPITLTPDPFLDEWGIYSECVTVRVWMKTEDFSSKNPAIEIHTSISKLMLSPTLKNANKLNKRCHVKSQGSRVRCVTKQLQYSNTSFTLWELVHDCADAEAGSAVYVSYSAPSTRCNVTYTVRGPRPDFDLSVDQSSKSINVTVKPQGDVMPVYANWCYLKRGNNCLGGPDSKRININPSQPQSAVLTFPYLLPCVCVQVYYTYTDAWRRIKCLFQNSSLIDHRDVWRTSEVALYESKLTWSSECPANSMNISASLCWMQREHVCTPILGSTLEKDNGPTLVYNTSMVDKHPQMCVRFSLQDSHNITCLFTSDMSSWEAYIGPSRQSIVVYLTSSAPAKFSAQLCVLTETGCRPMGPAHSLTMDGNTKKEKMIYLPLRSLAEKPCVQVWQSDPALHGRRILCPDYMRNRSGLYAVAVLIFVTVVALMGIFIHRVTKSGATGCLYIQKPLLLVCSSDQPSHVSAVCAFASFLQGELGATVHTALWAQSSQRQAGTQAGVADLGPLPWLYGQWEAVCKAQGKVLIIWSPEAKKTYDNWREEKVNLDEKERNKEDSEKVNGEVEEKDLKLNGRKWKKAKATENKDGVKLCDDKDWCQRKEASMVIGPVFKAALACLEGALQRCKTREVAIVYFHGLGHGRDIPKAFRGIPRFCLPEDFGGLMQELGQTIRRTKTGKYRWHCWPRLLSKVLSVWLARRLAQRLQTLLPKT
ncbi:interleukin-17 receptor E [Stegastes partitus]|uniref:Interleukin-17 receptor E-like n=1 Tax=Stegastes partitus TaxID=144197 RepID=A0A3B5B3Y8_9TELE|nr:PREDICTED: interleukin-17 receptor E-like [Stegastes partitus]